MSKIFELYGHRLDCWNEAAEHDLSRAWCPFMDAECDGGGNRFQSAINLGKNAELSKRIPGKETVQVGICSLQTHEGAPPPKKQIWKSLFSKSPIGVWKW